MSEPRLALSADLQRPCSLLRRWRYGPRGPAPLGVPTSLYYPGETPAVHRFMARKGLLKTIANVACEESCAGDRRVVQKEAEGFRDLGFPGPIPQFL
ncbi:hypothetical protein HRbin02_01180 [Candidatus Calditenuaceae archaeon HR02]|nr:hypothetical protein HRbin02_01180 [Candidatus Calditenuaceae archaeon HR02]